MIPLFASLTWVEPDGSLTNLQADSINSDDQTLWRIRLRDGWAFHNGEPVTAKSFVDAWNYVAYGPNAFENSGELSNIVGYDLNSATDKPATKEMSGLKVVDNLTFTVQLKSADSQFPSQLSQMQTGFYPMPESAYSDMQKYADEPIGNGPYQMAAPTKPGKEYTIKRYEAYKGPKGKADTITFRPYTDNATAYTDVLAGQADIANIAPAKFGAAKNDFGNRVWANDAPSIDYLGFPLWDPRYADKRVRQAISMSIDRAAVNKAIFGGLYDPATAFTPPAEAGTPEGLLNDEVKFDPTEAKKLLAEAGGFNGTITFVYPGGYNVDDLYKAYANQVRQNLGVEAVAKPTTGWSDFYSAVEGKTVAGPHFGTWGALYSSQQNTLRQLFTKAGTGNVYTGYYTNPAVDSALAAAEQASTESQVNAAYKQAQEVLKADLPVVPTFFSKYVYVTSPKITKMTASLGVPILAQLSVSK
ncbi:ABC transporter substrate-binding protein [Dactylosporangium fulvum]|uniref:ABC transporter substrate-binding protein n=1 Tax=Dactylosporangium fulvum TaxID=53359 RepID=A0ABY5WBN7_9ACTN|nr:ABC transporter substrate-binding protein [Dactylosporangium fulvum]UWP86444.1 ABC transporter substrate-binding protein [Dactylosporangium fulvum]